MLAVSGTSGNFGGHKRFPSWWSWSSRGHLISVRAPNANAFSKMTSSLTLKIDNSPPFSLLTARILLKVDDVLVLR